MGNQNENIFDGLIAKIDAVSQATDDFRNDRERPYNGQPHTDKGVRGKQEVKGLTMRDIHDCFVMGLLESVPEELTDGRWLGDKVENITWCDNDMYGFDLDKVSPGAICQNMLCNVEKMMGIYPNVDSLEGKKFMEDFRDFMECGGEPGDTFG